MTIATVWSMTAESKYVTSSKMKLRQMGASKEDFTKETKALKWKQTSSLQHSSLGNRAREQRMISKYLTRKETIHLSLLKARHVLAIAKALYSDLIHGIVSSILRTLSFECKTGSSFWQRYPFRPKSTFVPYHTAEEERSFLIWSPSRICHNRLETTTGRWGDINRYGYDIAERVYHQDLHERI